MCSEGASRLKGVTRACSPGKFFDFQLSETPFPCHLGGRFNLLQITQRNSSILLAQSKFFGGELPPPPWFLQPCCWLVLAEHHPLVKSLMSWLIPLHSPRASTRSDWGRRIFAVQYSSHVLINEARDYGFASGSTDMLFKNNWRKVPLFTVVRSGLVFGKYFFLSFSLLVSIHGILQFL